MKLTPQQLLPSFSAISPSSTLWLAYSGGLDSSCLLHALAELSHQQLLVNPIKAIHIHHGLSLNADAWLTHCQQQAHQLQVPLTVIRVDATPESGESPEAAARNARYQAIAEQLSVDDVLLTAHHQDDQAETLLIQLLRGSGVKGLAAMPSQAAFAKGLLFRPLLDYSRVELERYAKQHGLTWVEDESNQSDVFDRNYLRNQVIPLIQQRWPSSSSTLSRSAKHCAESAMLCEELAREDLQRLALPDVMTLPVAELLALSLARQNNLLRYWISQQQLPLPTSQQLRQVTSHLLIARGDSEPCVKWPGAELRRFAGKVYLMPPLLPHDPNQVIEWAAEQEVLNLPGLGLVLQRSALSHSNTEKMQVRFRQGGERIQLPGQSHHTSLKKLFQQRAVPPWQRDRLPLIYLGQQLIAIYGLV